MHDLLDDYAYKNALRTVNPRMKLLLGFASILVCAFSTSLIAPLAVAISMSSIIVVVAKIPLRFYIKLLLIPLPFVLFSAIAILLMQGGDSLYSFTIFGIDIGASSESANLALLLFFRTLGGMSSMFFIALTTPMVEIFSILKSIGIPAVLIELSMLIYRYIFVLLDQAETINNAQVTRLGDSSLKASLKSFSMLSSVLFLRAWEQGERLMIAMDSRCYDGRLEVIDQNDALTPRSVSLTAFFIAAITAIAFLTRDMRLL